MRLDEKWQQLAAGREYSIAMREFGAYKRWYSGQTAQTTAPAEDEETMAAAKLANKWLVGCDPEFVVLDDKNRIVNTALYIPHDGIVGWDHSGNVVEIRPQPCKGTFMLLKRLQKEILQSEALKKLEGFKWRAGALVKGVLTKPDNLCDANGARTITLGGHVHIDQPPNEYAPDFKQLIEALDRLTHHLEQLDILPKAECLARRNLPEAKRLKYGQRGDWRRAGEDGVHARMEYRVMASWLYHPHAAYICLTGAKLCATAPMLATEFLKPTATQWDNLRGFFEAFRHKDSNAQRLLEKLVDGKELRHIQHDPDGNFRQNWEKMGL